MPDILHGKSTGSQRTSTFALTSDHKSEACTSLKWSSGLPNLEREKSDVATLLILLYHNFDNIIMIYNNSVFINIQSKFFIYFILKKFNLRLKMI